MHTLHSRSSNQRYLIVLFNYLFWFQLSLVQLSVASLNGKDMNLSDLRRNCPAVQTDFWQCMNHTLHGKLKSHQYH